MPETIVIQVRDTSGNVKWVGRATGEVALPVSTEMSDAVAAADNMANPTAPWTLSALMGWDGSGWDRVKTSVSGRLLFNMGSTSGQTADGSTVAPAMILDTSDTQRQLAVSGYSFNGSTYDRPRNNVEGTALASAARTASTQSPDIVNYNGRGVLVFVDVTAVTATPSITVAIEGKDPVSGKYFSLLTGAALTAVSTQLLVVYPGVTETANADVATPLPRTWRVNVTHADADSITYSIGYAIIL